MTGRPWLPWALGAVAVTALTALTAVGATVLGARRWAAWTRAMLGSLEAGRTEAKPAAQQRPARYDVRELAGLPAPVQRYFRAVLMDGQPLISAVRIDMAGRFNLSATGAQWKPFTSRQHVVTRRPGFVWDATIAMLPGVDVRVVDSYIAGKGLLRAALQGLFTMAQMQGEGEIARGELMRWFAEVPWYPTALLPGQGVRWDAVDAHAAKATVLDSPLQLTLLFRFNDAGLIDSVHADARGAKVGKQLVMAPWEGTWSNYQWRDGVQVPCTGEVAWMRPEGRRPYFVGTVTALRFEFAQ